MPPKEVPQKKGKQQTKGKAVPAKPVKKVKVPNPLFQSKPRNQRIGGDLRVWNLSLSLYLFFHLADFPLPAMI